MSELQLPSASIENEFLRLEYLTEEGPRIIGLYAKGVAGNLFAITPNVHWQTPHGEYYPRGGHRLWTAPEDPFYTCPEQGLHITKHESLLLKGPVDEAGLEKEIAIRLDQNRVHLSHRVTWHRATPIELAAWSITQVYFGGMAILPLPHKDGLLPDRNLVLWPYSEINDDRFELEDDLVLVHGRAKEFPFKVGTFNSHGWIAYALGKALFIKRFIVDETGRYPDFGCNAEAYVKDAYVELESLGTLKMLNPGEFVTYEETWEVIVGDFPATTDSARNIVKQLSQE